MATNYFLKNLNRKRVKSWNKYEKALLSYITLLKREKKEGNTNWIADAKIRASKKLDKYGITQEMVNRKIESKWLKDLLS